jgi:hypothetical protein
LAPGNSSPEIALGDLQLDELRRAIVARQAGSDALAVFPNSCMYGNNCLVVAGGCLAALLGVTDTSVATNASRHSTAFNGISGAGPAI